MTAVLITTFFGIKKYIFVGLVYFLYFFFSKFKKIKLLDYRLLLICFLIFISNLIFFHDYHNFSFLKKIGWSFFYFIFFWLCVQSNINNEKILRKYIFFIFFSISASLITDIFINIHLEYPILRNGLITFNVLFDKNYINNMNEIEYYKVLYKNRVGISFFYFKLYLILISLTFLHITEKSKFKKHVYNSIFIIILIFGSSFGSRSFIFFYFASMFFLFYKNYNLSNFLFLFSYILIFSFNINFFHNDYTTKKYLNLFNQSEIKLLNIQERLEINDMINNESFNITTKRFSKDLDDLKNKDNKYFIFESRVKDNYIGFFALVLTNNKEKFIEIFEKLNPKGYFINQKFFHNSYLNFYYLGNTFAFTIFLFLNILFLYYLFLHFKFLRKKKIFLPYLVVFLSFQYIMGIETPFLTDRIFFCYWLFFFSYLFKIKQKK